MKSLPALAALAALLAPSLAVSQQVQQQEQPSGQQSTFPPEITFAISGGLWQDASGQKGYYRLFSVRQPDRSARVALQKMAVSQNGATVLSTSEISAISNLHARVTSISPKDPSGAIRGPGFYALVNVTDERGSSAQTLAVVIDASGSLSVGRVGK